MRMRSRALDWDLKRLEGALGRLRTMWRFRGIVTFMGLAVIAVLVVPAVAPAQTVERADLEEQKLRAEIRKLELEIAKAESRREDVLAWAPLIATLAAIGGVVVPVLREVRQNRRTREEELKQRGRELEQRTLEAQRTFDERYGQAVANLASDNDAAQIAGAATLGTLLRPEYAEFHDDVYRMLYPSLLISHSPAVQQVLVPVFSKALRLHLARAEQSGTTAELQFARASLPGADLSGLDLRGLDVAFADLRGADLSGCSLVRALGFNAQLERARLSRSDLTEARFVQANFRDARFHESRLVSASLKDAVLAGAELYRAQMQGAHLDDADLRGARFDGAEVADTYFRGAAFDDGSLESLLHGPSWPRAHFDPETRARLERLAQRRSAARA